MKGSEALQLFRFRLARFTADATTLTDEMLLVEMNLAQKRLEEEACLPWFLISEMATEQTVPHDERVQLPDTFIRELETDSLWLVEDSGKLLPLGKAPLDALRERFADVGEAKPRGYAISGNYFRLRPVPDTIYNLRMSFFEHDASVVKDVENRWLKYETDLLIAEAGQVVATLYLRDDKAAGAFGTWRQERYAKMKANEDARTLTNMPGTPED